MYNPINLNLYHYGGNNPLRMKDPDGRESEEPTLAEKNPKVEPESSPEQDGSNVFAVEGGTYKGSKWNSENNHDLGLGDYSTIKTPDGAYMNYGHLDPNETPEDLEAGDEVEEGQHLGRIADPTNGNSTGPHVNLERYEPNEKGKYEDVDPGKTSPLGAGYPARNDYPKYENTDIDHTGRDFSPPK